MRTWMALGLLVTLASCAHGNSPAAGSSARIDHVERGLVEFTSPIEMFRVERPEESNLKSLPERMRHYHVPGVSLAVIEKSTLAWAKPYGVLRADGDGRVTNESYFQAASTSKTVAAAIVLHYVGEGVLRLDEDVNAYLETWQVPANEFTREKKVTLRLLLTHQAGLPAGNFTWQRGTGDPSLLQVLNGELPATNKPAVVQWTPGSKWQYSNIGFVVIQQILEDVTGKPYAQIAEEIVFRPLGMKHSTFVYPLKPALSEIEAMPHDAEGTVREPVVPPTALAQGGLITTPSDLALFSVALMRAFKGEPNSLLSREMAQQMFHKELDLDPKMFGGPFGEGLGLFLHGEGEDLALVSPGANDPGMNCWLVAYPAKGRGVVVMTNGALGELLAMEIISAVNREYGAMEGPAS